MPDLTGPELAGLTIGILGGSGAQGRGLAYRWAVAGLAVLIGSRDAGRARAVAAELGERSGSGRVRGADNLGCAAESDLVLVAVPYAAHRALLESVGESLAEAMAGKIVIDCVNPIAFDERGPYAVAVPEGSAAQQAALVLPGSRVTAAFHHVSAVLLDDPEVTTVRTDVLVLGDDRPATDLVCALAAAIPGVRGIYGGRLRNAGQVEAFTANLIAINRRYRTHAGITVTGVSPGV